MSNLQLVVIICILVVDCQWTAWNVGECSLTCGGGTRINTRSKTVEEENAGVCTGESTAEEDCNSQECPGKIDFYLHFKLHFIFHANPFKDTLKMKT